MKAVALGYHDVFEGKLPDDGGLRPHAAHYALERSCFRNHLETIGCCGNLGIDALDCFRQWEDEIPIFLTFDDGAIGSYSCIADELEKLNLRGHFFIVSSWIGRAGFMDRRQILDLRKRGHVIGSHSRSHPERMPNLTGEQLQQEWSESCAVLSDLLGEACVVASVPNGYYSRVVGETASSAGIRVLFNSEPAMAVRVAHGCLILGRYAIKAGDPPETTGDLVTRRWPRVRQRIRWDVVKAGKALGGSAFLAARGFLLSRRAQPAAMREPGK